MAICQGDVAISILVNYIKDSSKVTGEIILNFFNDGKFNKETNIRNSEITNGFFKQIKTYDFLSVLGHVL